MSDLPQLKRLRIGASAQKSTKERITHLVQSSFGGREQAFGSLLPKLKSTSAMTFHLGRMKHGERQSFLEIGLQSRVDRERMLQLQRPANSFARFQFDLQKRGQSRPLELISRCKSLLSGDLLLVARPGDCLPHWSLAFVTWL